jgi:hypothetical protein
MYLLDTDDKEGNSITSIRFNSRSIPRLEHLRATEISSRIQKVVAFGYKWDINGTKNLYTISCHRSHIFLDCIKSRIVQPGESNLESY